MLESIVLLTVALGAAVAPLLVHWLGPRGALVAAGLFLPAVLVPSWTNLLAIDRDAVIPERQLELLRAIPIFAPLPPATLEQLASSLTPVHLPAGATLFRSGDPGDRFYVVSSGEVEIAPEDKPPARHGPGAYFGEIALLRDVPRTATVTAATDAELWALERDPFVSAVTGYTASSEAAEGIVAARLAPMTI